MSTHSITKRVSVPELRARKNQEKVVALTAYSCAIARIIDDYVDLILVGDSTAMVAYGHPNTLSITVDQVRKNAPVSDAAGAPSADEGHPPR